MSLSLDEIREFSLMALDQPPAVKKVEESDEFKFLIDTRKFVYSPPRTSTGYFICYVKQGCHGEINWGDGTDPTTLIETPSGGIEAPIAHNYNSHGEYVVTIKTSGLDVISFNALTNPSYIQHGIIDILTPFPKTMAHLRSRSGQIENYYGYFFYDWLNIETIPNKIFRNCKDMQYAANIFRDCSALVSVPSNLFDDCQNITNFNRAFYGCYQLTHLPEIWITHPNASHTECFKYCNDADNYNDVPSDWR